MRNLLLCILLAVLSSCSSEVQENQLPLTHGPVLGALTSNSVKVWGRTAPPDQFYVRYGLNENKLEMKSVLTHTQLQNDNTGTVILKGLKPGTKYYYAHTVLWL